MNRKAYALSGLALLVVLLFAINILADGLFRGARIDLTERGLYTLSDGTRKVVAGLDEPIRLRLFYSEKLATTVPDIRVYGQRVRDLLEEIASVSDGKVQLEVIDPEPFSTAEDLAVASGVRGVPVSESGDQLYFGLVGRNSTDDEVVIPFFRSDREPFLEYELTRAIYRLGHPARQIVGILTALPMEYGPGGIQGAMQGRSQPYALLDEMRDFYDVRFLDPTALARVPDDVTLLLVAHPKKFSPTTLYAIDQFVLGGGRAMIFVDPFSETELGGGGGMMPSPDRGSDLGPFTEPWGISMVTDRFVADIGSATRVGYNNSVVDYVAWLGLGEQRLNQDIPLTAGLGTINMASPGALERRDDAPMEWTPLITSSPQATLMETERIAGRPEPDKLLIGYKPEGGARVLAALLRGEVPSAFPDGPPAPEPAAEDAGPKADEAPAEATPMPAPLARSNGPVNVLVVADSDMLADRFWVRRQNFMGEQLAIPTAANASFVINALEHLSGSDELIGLRSRGFSSRPFEVVEDIRREAEGRYREEENRLQLRLQETENRIAELESKVGGTGDILPKGQAEAIESFRQELLETRRALRQVQRDLRGDIDALETRIQVLNIGLMPLLVALIAIFIGLFRISRRHAGKGIRHASQ
ncbi:Gldg family protein [Oceanibacterium hippocampi]|uniref:ABC-type uncharacterized transport system n=1 Tax=Oceanibacterium hippocampi TaxID=745714 RepID=A0A1Y5RHB8_9PROT|nr:Gldg family protein [Oceanibacterium hippocampi]SLN14850.1 ABC-type uncharacterized transport system [Oceanibacterium hippocampi]